MTEQANTEQHAPARVLGTFDAGCIVIGAIIGVGIFFTPSRVAANAGSVDLAILAWVLGGVIALFGALTFAGIGRVYHGNGAQYAALRDSFGPAPAFLFVFCNATAVQAGAIAIIAAICVEHVGIAIAGRAPAGLGLVVLSIALAVALAGANVVGVRFGSAIQNLTVVMKIGTLLAIGAAAAWAAPAQGATTPAEASASESSIIVLLFTAMVPAFFSYGGWQHALWIAGEVKSPKRTLPIAIIGGVIIVMVIYVMAAWAFFRLLGLPGVTGSKALAADAVQRIWPGVGARVTAGAVALSALGVLNAQLLSGPRLLQGMARDGRFFAPFGHVHPRFGTPDLSIWLLVFIACALLAAAGKNGVDLLLSGVVFVDSIFFALTGIAAVALARKGVRVPGGPVMAVLFTVGVLGVTYGSARNAGTWSYAIIAWIAAGAALYWFRFRNAEARDPQSIDEWTLRVRRLPKQLLGQSPFQGTIVPGRVALLSTDPDRPCMPFPHPWNYREPLKILGSFFHGADDEKSMSTRHNRYVDVPGFAPVLVTRDPGVIRAISTATGDKPGQFDRDTLPTGGIARATGEQTLLYANGASWRRQKQMAAPPFARSTLYQPEVFGEFAETFREIAIERLELVRRRVHESGQETLRVHLESEIKTVMLDMLVNCFFGASVEPEQIRCREVPALDTFIDSIVRDTVMTKAGCPIHRLPRWVGGVGRARDAAKTFEGLTARAIEPRTRGVGLWKHFKSDAPDDALRPNIRVFLAGALEATTSYASWALSHLARDQAAQERLFQEVRGVTDYSPEVLGGLEYLGCVLNETLRLTPALYFHPRRATVDTWVETEAGDTLFLPSGTHVLLDVWHANRHEDHWGVAVTGHPADRFVPERWLGKSATDQGTREWLHFGFGHGPRFCPGKNLGQMEVALVVGAVIKLFEIRAVNPENPARAGVSTKPADGVLVELRPR